MHKPLVHFFSEVLSWLDWIELEEVTELAKLRRGFHCLQTREELGASFESKKAHDENNSPLS